MLFEVGKIEFATAALLEIENKINADGGATFRRLQKKYFGVIEDAFDDKLPEPRSHLGASLIGDDCVRKSWYGWRWAKSSEFPARMLRLFNRGHLEEARMMALLEMIGCQVWHVDENGKQFRVEGYKGHFGGGCDAVIKNLPGFPNEILLAEFKTHNDKSFNELVKKGVKEAKKVHYRQMCVYGTKLDINLGLYMAANKNDDEIHMEIITIDNGIANEQENKAIAVINADRPPSRISNSSADYRCKFCDFRSVCFGVTNADKNCRTCTNSRVQDNGVWVCSIQNSKILSKQEQMKGCSDHVFLNGMGT